MKEYSTFLMTPSIGDSPSDDLVSYPGHTLVGFYPSEGIQSLYFTAPTDWAENEWIQHFQTPNANGFTLQVNQHQNPASSENVHKIWWHLNILRNKFQS